MRFGYLTIYIAEIIILALCSVQARRTDKNIKGALAFVEAAVIVPLVGNVIVLLTDEKLYSLIGYYMYYLGSNLMFLSLVYYTNEYCKGIGKGKKTHKPTFMYLGLAADSAQLIMNIFFGHAFELIYSGDTGVSYYEMIPYFGLVVHIAVGCFIILCIILIFALATAMTPKIYREKYMVILGMMLFVALFRAYHLLMKIPDYRSAIGYGVLGIVLFYFAVFYRPQRFLDQMLSDIISGLPDSFFIFDSNSNCVWANREGLALTGATDRDLEIVTDSLKALFGPVESSETGTLRKQLDTPSGVKYYDLQESKVRSENGKLNGYYLRIQDVTEEETELRNRDEQIGKISREAYKDDLTGVGSKAAYARKIDELNKALSEGQTDFAVVMMDANDLKKINDSYGHEAGNEYIIGCCRLLCQAFKHSPVFRIGGDEFVAILQNEDYDNKENIIERLRREYDMARLQTDREPWLKFSASVGISVPVAGDDSYDAVFRHADKNMYEDKHAIKNQK